MPDRDAKLANCLTAPLFSAYLHSCKVGDLLHSNARPNLFEAVLNGACALLLIGSLLPLVFLLLLQVR